LLAGQSLAIEATAGSATNTIEFKNVADSGVHFALFAAEPVKETFVQKGPFIMNNDAEIAQIEADYAAGRLGHLE